MLASLLGGTPTLSVTIEQNMMFVRPSVDPDYPSEDPILRGTVLLSLPSRKTIKKIKVLFEGLCDAYGGEGFRYETSTTLHKELEIDISGEMLEAGNHAFNFAFIVPSSTAVYQRSVYGRVRHYVKATAECTSGFSTSLASPSVAVFLSASPAQPNDIPEPLDVTIEHFSEDLGPIIIGVSSPHLTVASLVALRLGFVCPSVPVTINSIKSFISQQFVVAFENGSVATPPPKYHPLQVVDETSSPSPLPSSISSGPVKDVARGRDPDPLVELVPGEEWRFSRLARVLDDDHIRPTTLEGTDTRIRVSHKWVLQVRYCIDGVEKNITIQKPVTITSCCSLIDSGYLPVYVKATPKTIIRPLESRCLCNLSLKEMVDRDGERLQQAGPIELPTDSRVLGVERIDKSPVYQAG